MCVRVFYGRTTAVYQYDWECCRWNVECCRWNVMFTSASNPVHMLENQVLVRLLVEAKKHVVLSVCRVPRMSGISTEHRLFMTQLTPFFVFPVVTLSTTDGDDGDDDDIDVRGERSGVGWAGKVEVGGKLGGGNRRWAMEYWHPPDGTPCEACRVIRSHLQGQARTRVGFWHRLSR